VHGLAVVQAVT